MTKETTHIVAMTRDELESYIEDDFADIDHKNQRAFATIMLMISDYQDFIVERDLWDDFIDSLDHESQEVH